MASKSCTACLAALRVHSRAISQRSSQPLSFRSIRTFTTSSPRYLVELPEPNATATTSIPPVTPERAQGLATASKPSLPLKAAAELRKVAGGATETYTAYGVTENLFRQCAKQADYTIPQATNTDAEMPKTEDGEDLGVGSGWWHTELGLKPTFSTWSQVTMLHMYLLSVRFRCFPPSQSPAWQQHLLDHFFYDAENRMTINHNMHARGTRNRYLKDLFIQWRGLLAAYDEGIVKGDAVLAAAVWRNIFKADEEVEVEKVATIVSYMRRVLKSLDAQHDEVVAEGRIGFGDPSTEVEVVKRRSKMMDLPLTDGKIVDQPVTA